MAFASSCAFLSCGDSPPPAAATSAARGAPSSASTVDPITGLPKQQAVQRFAPAKDEHLCKATEDVVFSCTLEGPPPQAVTSLCLKTNSPRNDPVVVGRERTDGQTEEPFAGQSSHLMITVLEADGTPFSIELEQLAEGGAIGIEKGTDLKAPNKAPLYRRSIRIKRSDAAAPKKAACDPARPITDNFDAMRAYKL